MTRFFRFLSHAELIWLPLSPCLRRFEGKHAQKFDEAKTSSGVLANHVISECVYPNKVCSNAVTLWLLDGFSPSSTSIPTITPGALGPIFRFPRFAGKDATLSGCEQPLTQLCLFMQVTSAQNMAA